MTASEQWEVGFEADATGFYVVANGKRIASRGRPNTPQAKTWITLIPGWHVMDGDKGGMIVITHNGEAIH